MRHSEPEFLKQYWAWIRNGPPRCCHTCEEYDGEGRCGAYNMEPPEGFASTTDNCPAYSQMVPF